jgi:hypothetical protein
MLGTMLLAALPILVELFTSEGCSSCPPADAVLSQLRESQPVPGVDLLVLSEHVDYWNDLGWRDPFSQRLFTERQSHYGPRAYTPQAMVDGRIDVLGSDAAGIERAAKSAAGDPHGSVAAAPAGSGKLRVEIAGLPHHGDADVIVAVVEDGLSSKVERGENAGRTLSHTAVVRSLKNVARIRPDEAGWAGTVEVPSDPGWKQTRTVVFVQARADGHVLAAGAPTAQNASAR